MVTPVPVMPSCEESRDLWRRSRLGEGILTGPGAVAWVAVSFLVLRAVAWFHYDPVTFDSALYFEMAALFRTGHWSEALAYDYPPLYPLLIAGLQPLVGSAETAGLLVAFLADLLILWPILAIARRAVGNKAAWAAAFLWVAHLSAIRFGVQATSDAPTALCVAAALSAGLHAVDQRSLRWAWGAGVASGVAFLFRPEGLEAALALAAFYALQWHQPAREPVDARKTSLGTRHSVLGTPPRFHELALSSRARSAIRRAGWVLAPLVGWVLVAGPYVAHISAEAGALTLSKKKSATSFVRSVGPLPSLGHQAPEAASREERQPARSPGASWVHRSLRNVYVFQKPVVNGLTVVLIVPACVGLAGILTRRKDRWNPVLGLLAGLFVLHFGILVGLAADKGATYLGRHHALLLVLYALPVAGAGLVWTLRWMGDRLRSHRWVPATALCIILVATGFAVVTRGPDQGRTLRTAAAWIRSQVVGTPVIVTSLAKLTYHAHAERVDIRGTYDEILRRGRERSAHFVALYPDLIDQTSPDFLVRLSSADLELVKVFPEPTPQAPDQRLELYRFRAQETGTSKGP